MNESQEFSFKLMTTEVWQATSNDWMTVWADSQPDENPVFMGIINRSNPANPGYNTKQANQNRYVCYAVTRNGEDSALAIVELVDSKSTGQLRLLSVSISPALEQTATSENRNMIDEISFITSEALLGALELCLENVRSVSLKVWLSYPMTAVFLRQTLAKLGKYTVDVAGNWIIISITKSQSKN